MYVFVTYLVLFFPQNETPLPISKTSRNGVIVTAKAYRLHPPIKRETQVLGATLTVATLNWQNTICYTNQQWRLLFVLVWKKSATMGWAHYHCQFGTAGSNSSSDGFFFWTGADSLFSTSSNSSSYSVKFVLFPRNFMQTTKKYSC